VALENIRILEEEKLVQRVHDELASVFARELATLSDHPLVGEVRSVGLLGAVELVRDKSTRARFEPAGVAGTLARDHCIEQGLIMRACGDAMVLSPPLIISEDEIAEIVVRARRAFDLALRDLERRGTSETA